MATLGSIINQLSKEYELGHKKLGDDHFVVEVKFDDGRTQLVEVAIRDDGDERSWMFLHSIIGPVEDLDLHELLKRNDAPGYSYVAADDEQAFVQAQIPLENTDAELAQEMIFSVATMADALEEEFIGSDDA